MLIDFHAVGQALAILFGSWWPWLVMVPGLLVGLLFTAIPGINIAMAMLIVLPFTTYMDFTPALIFLTSIYTGGSFGHAIPAILFNIPGSVSAVATTFDGYPMTQRGDHNEALGLGLSASCISVALGYGILLLIVVLLANFVLKLGPPDMLLVALWGLSLIAAMRGRSISRGLIAGLFGLLLGMVGFSERGNVRGTLGIDYLLDGIPAIPVLVGMFCAAPLFKLLDSQYLVSSGRDRTLSVRRIGRGIVQAVTYPAVIARGSVIGILVGAMPGVGGAVANLISYNETRRASRHSERFGTGEPAGVVAAEAANGCSEAGSIATLLALGIPGGGVTAVMLSVFSYHNISSGPRFMADHRDVVYALILSGLIEAVACLFVGIAILYLAVCVVRVPVRILVPSIFAVVIFGCFSVTQNMSGPVTFLFFAILGVCMEKFDYPANATVIGLLLAHLTESELLRTYQLSVGNLGYFVDRPITITLFCLFIATLLRTPVRNFLAQRRQKALIEPSV